MKKWKQAIVAVMCVAFSSAQGAVDIRIEEPVDILQRAAALGEPTAQFNLALRYQEGRGVDKDPAAAEKWYRKSAEGGFPAAQYNLAVTLIQGTNASENEKEAARWFFAAAQNGHFEAQKAMIRIHLSGLGAEKSPAKALMWDMLARRTLELRHGQLPGLPPRPPAMRADGAAEITAKDGSKHWLHGDGTRETVDSARIRYLEHRNGCKTTVQPDGAWKMTYPSGLIQQATAAGRMEFRSPNGTLMIMEPDGSRVEEGDGTDQRGRTVRVRDMFGPDGGRLSHRVTSGVETYEERADGTRLLEIKVLRSDDVWVLLVQDIAENGSLVAGRVRSVENGAGPKGDEKWEIRRVIRTSEGADMSVSETYSEAGLISQITLATPRIAAAATPFSQLLSPAAKPPERQMPPTSFPAMSAPAIPNITLPPRGMEPPVMVVTSGGGPSLDDPTAFALPVDLKPMLDSLTAIETESRYFAGATEADYQRAQAVAKAYLIPLGITPQKSSNAPAWLRENLISQSTLHEAPLTPIADDRSSVIPFGVHGTEAIKMASWKHAESKHFIVHYVGDAEARLTMQYIEGAYTVITQLLNLDPLRGPEKSHVFVFSEEGWATYRTVKSLSPQLAGFAFRTELFLGADAAREDRLQSIKTLCHEVTHALVSRFYPGRKLPLWLSEGLAEYIAMRTMKAKGTVSSLKQRADPQLVGTPDQPMDVKRLFQRERYGSRTTPDRMAAFYANSQKTVKVLFEKLPVEGFSKFFNLTIAGNEPGVTFAAVYGQKCGSIQAFEEIVNRP